MYQVHVKALIREYLIKYDLKKSLQTFDEELQDKRTITKMDLILQLGLSKLVKRNNESSKPIKSLIEILISYLLNKKAQLEALTIASKAEQIEDIPVYDPTVSRTSKMKKQRPQSEYKPKHQEYSEDQIEIKEDKFEQQKPSPSPNKGAFELPPKQQKFNFQQEEIINNIEQPPRLIMMKKTSEKKVEIQQVEQIAEPQQVIQYQKCNIKQHAVEIPIQMTLKYDKTVAFNKRKPPTKSITQNIKKLLFQGTMAGLPKSWSQPFIFKGEPAFYGLHQLEGGPCGVLASVQAYYLKHFLFGQSTYSSYSIKQNCLMAAFADMFYKVNKDKLILAISTRGSSMNMAVSIESCDQLEYQIKSLNYLYEVLLENSSIFFSQNGVALFFYSLILSKGVENIEKEMDSLNNPLIGNHGHCTQEAVNLMLTGKAVSNCFDGCKQLDEMKLQGIEGRSEIGFLTIFEHFQYLEVGKNLKEPILPIWVICKEYHYSVIFGCNNDVIQDKEYIKTNLKEFDLVFYDGLNNPDDLIILTIRRLGAQTGKKSKKISIEGVQFETGDQVTPLIELLLRTKYGDLELDWNDSQPIL